MTVDFHTHTFPQRIAAAAIAKMQLDCHSAAFTEGTAQALRSSMEQADIQCSVVLPVATNPEKVHSINTVSAAESGSGLVYFGCIHPNMENAPAELEYIASLGLKGIKLHPVYQGVDLDDRRYLDILKKAAELDLIVVTHAGDDIGFPGVVRCSPEILRRALDKVGNVKLVLAHMGGWRNWDRVASLLADTGVYLDTSFSLGAITPIDSHYAPQELSLMGTEEFCALVRSFGAERVLFGTDSPWADQAQALSDIRALPLSEQEKSAILGKNACHLLKFN